MLSKYFSIHGLSVVRAGGLRGQDAGVFEAQFVMQHVTIPRYDDDAESLNVGIATAVLLDNWRRHWA